jgi:hypothetical protein
VNRLGERAGDALRRTPYAWLVTTFAVYWLLMRTTARLSTVSQEGEDASAQLAIVAAGLIASGVASSLVLVPRYVVPSMRQKRSNGEVALLRWAFAAAPFMIGFASVQAGAQQWALFVGWSASTVLLVIAARTLRRECQAGRSQQQA